MKMPVKRLVPAVLWGLVLWLLLPPSGTFGGGVDVRGEASHPEAAPTEPRDGTDRCAVCGMYPARYPRHRAQIVTALGAPRHFCSTQCLFAFLESAGGFGRQAEGTGRIWVTDFPTGRWILVQTAFFVTGSEVYGPMGFEAFAFENRNAAADFTKQYGGAVDRFERITPKRIMGRPQKRR